jgi:ceramide kinase
VQGSSVELKPGFRLSHIQQGSTDTNAYCTTGFNDIPTSVYQIALGNRLDIDVMGVYATAGQDEKLVKYCTSLLGYGYFGDIAYQSSKLRFLGPFRYIYSGKLGLLPLKSTHKTINGSFVQLKRRNCLTEKPILQLQA